MLCGAQTKGFTRLSPNQRGTKLAKSMTTAIKSKESGAAGKPGEATARTAAVEDASKAENLLSSAAVTSLLRSHLAETDEPEAGSENQNQREDEADQATADREVTEGAAAEATEGAESTEAAETTEATEGEEATEAEELEQALADPVKEWIENGKGKLPSELQAIVDKRIGKLTGEREAERSARETAEQERDAARAEAAELRSKGGAAHSPGPLEIRTEAELDDEQHRASQLIEDAEAYLDNSATDEERATMERYMAKNGLDEKGMKRLVRQFGTHLRDNLPAERQRLVQFRQQEQAAEPEAQKYYPWLSDKKDPRYAKAQEALRGFPDLPRRTPVHKLLLGALITGLTDLETRRAAETAGKNGNGKPAPAGKAAVIPRKAPPKPPGGGAAPGAARTNGNATEEAARQKLQTNGYTRANVTELLKSSLRGTQA